MEKISEMLFHLETDSLGCFPLLNCCNILIMGWLVADYASVLGLKVSKAFSLYLLYVKLAARTGNRTPLSGTMGGRA
jgi:hypothetical protein